MEHLHNGAEAWQLSIKQVDAQGHFSGYASIFNMVDSQKDMIRQGAFSKTLAESNGDIKLLWQHNFEEPIGVFTHLAENARGLYVEGTLLLDVQRAREAHALLKAGAIAGMSIGYVPVKHRIDPETGVRILEEVALYEISLVTFPANSEARVTTVKADEHEQEEKAEDWTAAIRSGQFMCLAEELERAIAVLR